MNGSLWRRLAGGIAGWLAGVGVLVGGLGLVGCEEEPARREATPAGGTEDGGAAADALDPALVAQGAVAYEELYCGMCHIVEPAADPEMVSIGPALFGLYGEEVTLQDGSVVVANEAYLRRAIEEPDAERVAGYYSNMVLVAEPTPDQTTALVEYIRSLKDAGPARGTPGNLPPE